MTVQAESLKTFKKICENLPYNRNWKFVMIHLKDANCDVIMPLRDNVVHEMEKAKDFYQHLADMAEL